MNEWKQEVLRNTVESMDTWIHRCVVLGALAVAAGADPELVDRIIHADKETVDKALVDLLKSL